MNKAIAELNNVLGLELGRNPYGEPVYQWDWSEDLFWPAYSTGETKERKTEGGLYVMERTYARKRMTDKYQHQWLVTKWFRPDQLTHWKQLFPDAPYPVRGYRVHTDFAMGKGKLPDREQTDWLIWQLKLQMGTNERQASQDYEDQQDKDRKSKSARIGDEIRDSFTAGLNPYPGKRGNFVSWQTGIGSSPHDTSEGSKEKSVG